MIFLKSTLVGIAAVFAALLLVLLCMVAYLSAAYESTVQWDPISLIRPSTWIVVSQFFQSDLFGNLSGSVQSSPLPEFGVSGLIRSPRVKWQP
jgi:hypothetical protein